MTIAAPVQRAITANENDSAADVTFSPSAAITVGSVAIVTYDCEDAYASSVDDSVGNTWVKVGSNPTTESGVFGSVYMCVVTTQIGTGNTVRIRRAATFQRPFNYVLYAVTGWTGTPTLDTAPSTNAGAGTGTAMSAGTTGVPQAAASLGFVYFANQKNLAITIDSPYTELTETGTTAGGIGTPHSSAGYNILSSAAAQSPTGSRAAGTSAYQGIAFTISDVLPGAPNNTVAPVVSGTIAAGTTLTTTDGTWDTSATFTYQWQRDGGNATWVNIAGQTSVTHVCTDLDIGSHIRCVVTGTNVSGTNPANSNSVGVIPAPVGVMSWRIVSGPNAQSDHQSHNWPLLSAVMPGETLLIFIACSNAGLTDGAGNKSDVGSITDAGSNTWVQDSEAFNDAGGIVHSGQVFSTLVTTGMFTGQNVTSHVDLTFSTGYHGQSPMATIVAINTGDAGSAFALDTQSHNYDALAVTSPHDAPSITTVAAALVFGFHVWDGATAGGWFTPAASFTEIFDAPDATTFGGESAYSIAAEAQIRSSAYTGGAGGTTVTKKLTNIAISYKPVTSGATPISSTDTAAGTDVLVETTVNSLAETGAGTEVVAATVTILSVQTAVGIDVSIVIGLQRIRPGADSVDGNWLNEVATNANLFQSLADSSDTTYVISPANPVNEAVRLKYNTITDPTDDTHHQLIFVGGKDQPGGNRIDITWTLYQGGGNVLGAGTLIYTATDTDVPAGINNFVHDLTSVQASAITDYTNLYIEISANQL